MRPFLTLLAVALGMACAPRVPIEGAPCRLAIDCPSGFSCTAGGCMKVNGPPPAGTGGGGGSSVGPTPGEGGPPEGGPPLPPTTPSLTCSDPGPAVMRRLTAEEYRNTVFDLTGVVVTAEDVPGEFPQLRAVATPREPVVPAAVEALLLSAEDISAKAIARPEELLPCVPDAPGANSCAREFIARFGARAYRRPLFEDEQMILMKAFEAGRAASGFNDGIRRVIEVVLGSPQFLYRIDLGEPAQRPGVTPLTPWEIATRLSYLLWVSMPDETLRAAAASGTLTSAAGIRAEAQRMLRDPRSQRTRESFLERWLGVSSVRTAPKPDKAEFNVELREALVTSARLTFARLGWEAQQPDLFGSPELMGNAAMARFYGFTLPSGPGFEVLRPTGDQKRFGLLTYPALLASLANGEEGSPVARGVLFVREVLCADLPPPPANIDAVKPPAGQPGATMRERLSAHVDNSACSNCHQMFDPVGLGLENYDGFALWRTHENGQPINAAGKLLGEEFDGPGGLAALLGKNDQVSYCLMQQWFRYTFGRDPQATDDCTLRQLKSAFMLNGRSFQALLMATVETDAFRTRLAVPGGGQ